MKRTGRGWMRAAVIGLLAATLVSVTAGGVGLRTSASQAIGVFGISLVFSLCIGLLLTACVPVLERAIFRRVAAPWNWMVLALAMTPVTIVGCALGSLILVGAGYLPGPLWTAFVRSVRIGLAMTVTFGLVVSAYELMRSELEAKGKALIAHERDEAEARRQAAEARQLAAEARLASLESRVQPHFLFNTLNSIASLIPTDPAGAERMTTQLASLLRSSLDAASTPLVPLADELMVVRQYLEIERVRLGPRLQFEIDASGCDPAVPVPRLSLQTLVENSIKYAVAPRREGSAIRVACSLHRDYLELSVEDDGPGFDASHLPYGHGLASLKSRLELLYGDRGTLRAGSQPGHSVLTIRIPAGHAA